MTAHGLIDTTPMQDLEQRAWSYVTLGRGHAPDWWQRFVAVLHTAGYDDVLSVEHEDLALPPLEMAKPVAMPPLMTRMSESTKCVFLRLKRAIRALPP